MALNESTQKPTLEAISDQLTTHPTTYAPGCGLFGVLGASEPY